MNWNFTLTRVILIFLCGIVTGGEIILYLTHKNSLLSASLTFMPALAVSVAMILSSRVKQK